MLSTSDAASRDLLSPLSLDIHFHCLRVLNSLEPATQPVSAWHLWRQEHQRTRFPGEAWVRSGREQCQSVVRIQLLRSMVPR